MQKALALVGLVLLSATLYLNSDFSSEGLKEFDTFQNWKQEHGKFFTELEDIYRFQVFRENMELAQRLNREENTQAYGINNMAAFTNQEFRERYTNPIKAEQQAKFMAPENRDITYEVKNAPSSWDWVSKGAVTPVQDQGACGSCWAFGTVGGLEGGWFLQSGNLEKFSEQQLVSCDTQKNSGCYGGLEIWAYTYTGKNGIVLGSEYPYTSGVTGRSGTCETSRLANAQKVNKSYFETKPNDPAQIVEAILRQPVSKGIDAGSIAFQLYSGTGVIDSKNCGTQMNHSVLLVGYDDTASQPFWEIKNSWGKGWGKAGFGRVLKEMQNIRGVCGINMDTQGPTPL